MEGLGLCIFGCKAQKAADQAAASAKVETKTQAELLLQMQQSNATIAEQNAALIALKKEETAKKTKYILIGGAVLVMVIGGVYVMKKRK